jgi:hypothetical protein
MKSFTTMHCVGAAWPMSSTNHRIRPQKRVEHHTNPVEDPQCLLNDIPLFFPDNSLELGP